MTHLDLRELVRAEHQALEAGHLEATHQTTLMHMDADDAEAVGDWETARLTRQVAEDQQAQVNRLFRPRSN